jgi:hypothetical protein
MNVVSLQFGTASLDSAGLSPILVTNPDFSQSVTGLIGTPESNVSIAFYNVADELYAVEASFQAATNFNYLIVSSR